MDAQTHGFITGGNDASKNIIFTGFLRSRDEDGGNTMVRSTYRWMGLVGWMERISSWSTRINNYFGRMHCNNDCLLLMHYSIQIGTLLHVLHGWSDWECVFECLREKCSSLFLCPIFWAITFENCDGKSVFFRNIHLWDKLSENWNKHTELIIRISTKKEFLGWRDKNVIIYKIGL